MTPDAFALTAGERSHPLWLRLEAYLTDRLATERARVGDNIDMTERQTAAHRGRIKLLEGLIALGQTRPIMTGD